MYEIERKFLLNCDLDTVLREEHTTHHLEQHYMPNSGDWTIRARRYDDSFFLTLKRRESDMTSREIETEINEDSYDAMVGMAVSSLRKTRHVLFHEGDMWEIDLFENGLVVAEVELTHEEDEPEMPFWVGEEVTSDKEYRSKRIAERLTIPQ